VSHAAPSKVNWPILVIGAVGIVALVGVLASGFGNDPRAVPSVLEGRPAPAFALVDLEGKSHDLAEMKGRPFVLNFWSTTCVPCRQEHDALQYGARANPDVPFFGVLYHDEPEKALRYLKSHPAAYPTLVDGQHRMSIDYGVAGVPETFFVDAAGKIVHKQVGPLDPDTLQALLERTRGQR
jgi:cytochrome c biogenesis protein CcmG/thiol:disulfide interchange protein DsbE